MEEEGLELPVGKDDAVVEADESAAEGVGLDGAASMVAVRYPAFIRPWM